MLDAKLPGCVHDHYTNLKHYVHLKIVAACLALARRGSGWSQLAD